MINDNLTVILVEPQGPLNVGSVCRVMMNFGFKELRLVNPCTDYKSEQARKMALSAQHMLIEAKLFNTLEQALADCQVAFGTTRRFGKYRKTFLIPEPAGKVIAGTIENNVKCALVLGREDSGLNSDELALCQHFVTIPTNDSFPSMNLSHSLGIFLYEISKAIKNLTKKPSLVKTVKPSLDKPLSKTPATIEIMEQMYSHMKKALCEIEFLDAQNPDHLLRTFRRIFGKAVLMDRDVRIIRGLMSKIEWVNSQRKQFDDSEKAV
ncbi:MAG: RNA methyltransferase [Desulfamplus sp.]|nr:RNA methyltransferase [Desulfamplus sp.]